MGAACAAEREEIERFIQDEARLLDERRFDDWMGLFADDGVYWVPARPDQENPYDEASLFFDDRELMKTRVQRLNHPNIHVQSPPSRTCHIITNIVIEEADPEKGEYVVSSNFMMTEYRLDNQRVFAGRYEHRLTRQNGSLKIVRKKAELVNCDSAFEAMAVPI